MKNRKTHQPLYQQLEGRLVLTSLRIANWNVANAPNTSAEDAHFETVIDAIGTQEVLGTARPIDILVLSETDSDSNQRLNDVFDNFYGTGFESTISSADGGGDRTGVIYNSATVNLIESFELPDPVLTHSILRTQFRPTGGTASEDFYVYTVHLISGGGSAIEQTRMQEAEVIRADADGLGQGTNVIFAGDFNLSGSSEAAWTSFTAAGNSAATDAANITGEWSDNSAFSQWHTHSTDQVDDRFDLQLHTDELRDGIGLDYVDGSVRVFGNDGTHTFDQPITTGTGASADVLTALSLASDHLPVVADFEIVDSLPGVVVVESNGATGVTEGADSDTYNLFLRTAPTATVQIDISTSTQLDLGNGPGAPIQLLFTPTNALTPQTVTVTAFDDALREGPHIATITHTVVSADIDYDSLSIDAIEVLIADDDASVTQPLLNEIFVDAPGADDNREYIEIIAPPLQSLTNVWLLEIEGSGANAGTVDNSQDLSSLQAGANGLVLLGEDYPTLGSPWSGIIDPATTLGDLTNVPLENGGITFLLVEGFTGSTGDDLDTNNDGVLDLEPWSIVWDGIGWIDSAADHVYTSAVIQQPGAPDAVTRIPGDFQAINEQAWYSGEIIGEGISVIYGDDQSANAPVDAVITPGATNFGQFVGDIAPFEFQLFNAVASSGDINSIQTSDDDSLDLRQTTGFLDFTPSKEFQIEFTGILPDLTPDALSFQIESRTPLQIVIQSFEFFNFTTTEFNFFQSSIVNDLDGITNVNIASPADYVDANTGLTRAQVTYVASDPTTYLPSSISIQIDHAFWSVNNTGSSLSDLASHWGELPTIEIKAEWFNERYFRVTL